MPYIPQSYRKELEDSLAGVPADPGGLNYVITKLIDTWLFAMGNNKPSRLSYKNINTAIGVLECVKLELYRRVAGPYEDKKKEENGEVYTCLT